MPLVSIPTASTVCCDHCPLDFEDSNTLNAHVRSAHRSSVGNSETCDACNTSFLNGDQLRTHIESTHKINAVVNTSTNFTKVSIVDNGSQLEKFECNICQHKTGTQNGIKAHISNKHSKPAAKFAVINDKQDEIRKYVLNIEKSIDKKLDCANRNPVTVNRKTLHDAEKSDGNSSMTLSLNLGVFEHMSNNLAKELKSRRNIDVIEKKHPKVPTQLFGNAIAEKQGEAFFKVNENEFSVNYTLYNTGTCNIFLQKSPNVFPELGKKTVAEYFATQIMVPMLNEIIEDNADLNKTAVDQLTVLKQQIKAYKDRNILEEGTNNKANKGIKSAQNTRVNYCKICNKDIKNNEAVGECRKCPVKEHIRCTGAKDSAVEYSSGRQQFLCSVCCLENSAVLALEHSPTRIINNDSNDNTHSVMAPVTHEEEGVKDALDEATKTLEQLLGETESVEAPDSLVEESNSVNTETEIAGNDNETNDHLAEDKTTNESPAEVDDEENVKETLIMKLKQTLKLNENKIEKLEAKLIEQSSTIESQVKTLQEKESLVESLQIELNRVKNIALADSRTKSNQYQKALSALKDATIRLESFVKLNTKLQEENKSYEVINKDSEEQMDEMSAEITRLKRSLSASDKDDKDDDESAADSASEEEEDIEDGSELDDDEIDELEKYIAAKKRGFKRTNPSVNPEKKTDHKQVNKTTKDSERMKHSKEKYKSAKSNSNKTCHFFNNGGCQRKELCTFQHRKSGECFSGFDCIRNFCPFRHSGQDFRAGRHQQPGEHHSGLGPLPPGHPMWMWGYQGHQGQTFPPMHSQWGSRQGIGRTFRNRRM